MGRRLFAFALALGLTVVSAASALAGGWAVTTLDALPAALEAGRTYRVGYTIRQHGQTPVDVTRFGGTTEVAAWTADMSQQLRFAGRPDGAPGHYIAEVRLPSAGRWTWQVSQGPFGPQPLGELVVQPAAAAPPPAASMSARPVVGLPSFLAPVMVGSSLALLAAMLFALRRDGRLAGEAGR